MTKRRTGLAAVAAAVLFFGVSSAWALNVKPGRQEIVLGIGETASGEIIATNDTDKPMTLGVAYRPWYTIPANKHIEIPDWLTLGKSELILEPGESGTVPFTVKVPSATAKGPAPEGMLLSMVSFSPRTESMVSMVISVSIYVYIRGTEKKEAELTGLSLRKQGEQIQVAATFLGKGNVAVRPYGEIWILDRKNGKVDRIYLEKGTPIYPDQKKTLGGGGPWPKWKNGYYRAKAQFTDGDLVLEKDFFFRFHQRKGIEELPEAKVKKLWRNLDGKGN